MYPCPLCTNHFSSINFFIGHFKLSHGTQQNSTLCCPLTNCLRSFNNIYAYKKHLIHKHFNNGSSSTAQCNNNAESTYVESEPTSNTELNLDRKPSNCSVDAERVLLSDIVEPCTSVSEFSNIISKAIGSFVTKLYANTSLNRALAQEVIQDVSELYGSTCYEVLKQRNNCTKCPDPRTDLNTMFELIRESFKTFSTEHETFNYLKNSYHLIAAESICIGATLRPRRNSTVMKIDVVDSNIQIVPLKILLNRFLKLPNVLESTLARLAELKKSDVMTSIVQGKRWEAIEKNFQGKIVLPLIMYFDDFEINNPLGSSRGVHKLGAVYFTIACFPLEYQSRLENILLVQLHHTKDQEKYGNKTLFANLIDQITELENNGIDIVIDGSETKIYFALALIIGDNLGLNSIFGFTTSFNSQYCCRICLIDKETLHHQVAENVEMLRTIENYNVDVSDGSRGVNEECVFNKIPNYHAIRNSSVDTSHDLEEGIFRYGIAKVLNRLVHVDKVFSLETLNDRIRLFDFNTGITTNIPPAIKRDALKSGCLIMSASEMSCLVQYLGLIIGDLVPPDDVTWQLYVILREMYSIIMAPTVTFEGCQLLQTLITEHHQLYMELFQENLKPKHHFLNHYPRLMQELGPLKNISTIRYEGKHQDLKKNSKVITSRVNPAYTLALKHQLQMAHRFLNDKGFDERLSWGVILQTDLSINDEFDHFKAALPSDFDRKCMTATWAEVNGTKYRPGMVLMIDDAIYEPIFGKIRYVIIDANRQLHFLLKKLVNLGLVDHVYAFQVTETQNWGFMSQKQLFTYQPYSMHVMTDEIYYVSCL